MTKEVPLYTVWFATGNNVSLKGDAHRRVLLCRLESKDEKPEERQGFRYEHLLDHVRRHRPELVCAALTILRAFIAAGRPVRTMKPFGSYDRWSGLIRAAIVWAIGVDPCETREAVRQRDTERAVLEALVEGWAELPGGTTTGLTVAEVLRFLDDPMHKHEWTTLRSALLEWSGTDKLPGAGKIGRKLRSFREQIANGKTLQQLGWASGHVMRWRVARGE
jgi:hypothetical protein